MGSKKENRENKDEKQKRLSAELRANLAKRKAQARSRRTGEADNRTEGIPSVKGGKQD